MTATTTRRPATIYRVENPYTGAVEFPERFGRLYSWAVYFRDTDGKVRHIGWSNADTAEGAIAEAAAHDITDNDYAATEAHTTTAGDRDAYLGRRARLAPTDAVRAKWASVLISAAVDYLRTPHDDTDSAVAKEHLADMVDQAMHYLGDKWEVKRCHTDYARRINTRADNAARMFLAVERDLDNRGRAEAIEYRLTQYLRRRDALIRELEAVSPF